MIRVFCVAVQAEHKLMRLVIHGGIHRTGTTTLQRFLATNRDFLLKQDILYPFDTVNHQRIAWGLISGRLSGSDVVEQLLAAIGDSKPTKVVLSGEDFCAHTDLSWLEPVRQEFDVRAHFYLRRQDLWLMSWYNQHIKWPFDRRKSHMTAEEFLQTLEEYHWLDFYRLSNNWVSALGRGNVQLHIFEDGTNVVNDFCRELEIDVDGADEISTPHNSSLPAEVLEFVRLFDIHSFEPEQRTRFLDAVRAVCVERGLTGNNVYSPMVRKLLLARFAESNRRTAIEYLFREDGKLFSDDAIGSKSPYVKPTIPNDAELIGNYVVPLVRALVTDRGKKRR